MKHEIDHLREGKRHHDEVDAAGTKHQGTGDQRKHRADGQCCRQRDEDRHRVVFRLDQCQRIAGQTEEGRMAQAHQSGIADQQIKAHCKDRQNHDLGEQLLIKDAAGERKQRQPDERHHEHDGERARVGLRHAWHGRIHRCGRCLSEVVEVVGNQVLRNRPSGRKTRTAAISR